MSDEKKKHLPRLEPCHYQGHAFVHWTMTIENRRTGWLRPVFLYKFRELLTHTTFRYAITCPIYCLMPDHLHAVWIGIDEKSSQLKAVRYFRKHVNSAFSKLGIRFQHQPHDRVLRDDERKETAFADLVNYIARNPERAGLVPADGFRDYSYTGCLVPGYPELTLWQDDFWPRFWRTYSFLRTKGLFRDKDEGLNHS